MRALALILVLAAGENAVAAVGEEVIEAVLAKAAEGCTLCHKFTEFELVQQSEMAQKRHNRGVVLGDKHCFDCHDTDELSEIEYHDELTPKLPELSGE